MESKIKNNEKVLLNLLCNDLYYKVKDAVNKYAVKQTDKDIVNAEETMIRVLYRDTVDSDIFSNFSALFAQDFYIINQVKMSKKGDKASFQTAINNVSNFLKSDQCRTHIKEVCSRYEQENKTDKIINLAIYKLAAYIPQLTQDEADQFRKTLLKFFKEVLLYCSNK